MFKKILAVLAGETLYTEDKHGGYAVINKRDLDIDAEGNVYGGEIHLQYGQEGMPPHHSRKVSEKDIEKAMREEQKDLRKWRYPEQE